MHSRNMPGSVCDLRRKEAAHHQHQPSRRNYEQTDSSRKSFTGIESCHQLTRRFSATE